MLQKQADAVYVDPELMEYAVRLVGASRRPAEYNLHDVAPYLSFGASPRASINLILGARALALTRGRDYRYVEAAPPSRKVEVAQAGKPQKVEVPPEARERMRALARG